MKINVKVQDNEIESVEEKIYEIRFNALINLFEAKTIKYSIINGIDNLQNSDPVIEVRGWVIQVTPYASEGPYLLYRDSDGGEYSWTGRDKHADVHGFVKSLGDCVGIIELSHRLPDNS